MTLESLQVEDSIHRSIILLCDRIPFTRDHGHPLWHCLNILPLSDSFDTCILPLHLAGGGDHTWNSHRDREIRAISIKSTYFLSHLLPVSFANIPSLANLSSP